MKFFALERYVFIALISAIVLVVGGGCSREAKISRYLNRANKSFEAGRYEVAEVEYLNLLQIDPTNHQALRNLGMMASEQGRLGQAFALLKQAKEQDPNDFQVHLRLAQSYLAGGGMEQAREEALLLLDKQPANSEVPLLLVESSATASQLADAEKRLGAVKSVAHGTAGFHLAWGVIELRKGDLQSAEQSFQKALALDPKSSAVYVAIGNLHALKKDRAQAEADYKKAFELAPARSPHLLAYVNFKIAAKDFAEAGKALEKILKQTPDYVPAQIRLAQIALLDRRFKDSEEIVKKVMARDPLDLEATLLLAQIQSEQGQQTKAIALLEQLNQKYPRFAQAHLQLARVQLENNDVAEAMKNLNQALNIQPDLPAATILLAEINIHQGNPDVAIDSLKKLITQKPDLLDAQMVMATAYQVRGNKDEALEIYRNLNRLDPANPQIPWRMGILLQQQGKNDDAQKSYEMALAIAPSYTPALKQLVGIAVAQKQFAAANVRVEKELAIDPKNPSLYMLSANVQLAQTNIAAAEKALLKAIEIDPDFGEAYALLGQMYVDSNREPEGLKKFQEATKRRPKDTALWFQLAQLYTASSNYNAARESYEKVLAINPQSSPALNNLAGLYLSQLKDPKQAYELANKARRLRPTDPAIADTLGWALYEMGDYTGALTLLKESAEKLPSVSEVKFHLGMVHYKMGEEMAAKNALRSALQLEGEESWRAEAKTCLRILETDPSTSNPKTMAELQGLLTVSPNDPILSARMASVFEQQGKWDKAAAAYEKTLTLNSNLVPVMVKLAKIYSTHLNDSPRALALARRARKLEPVDPKVSHVLGKIAFDSAKSGADYQWAFSLLQESANKLPTDPEVLFDYAWAAYSVGQLRNATATMERVILAKSASPTTQQAQDFVRMNALLDKLTEVKTAEITERLKAEPDYVPALMVTGRLQEEKKDFKTACDSYERILKHFPLFSPATKRLAELYYTPMGDTTKAYQYASLARVALPQDAQIARILGMVEFGREQYSRAAQLLTESAESYPTDSDLFYRLGIARYKLKQREESRKALKKALELSPNAPLATEAKRLLAEIQ